MANVPARARQIGFVFQHYALFRHMTVADNVAFGLRVRGRARRPGEAEIARRVGDLLDLVQMPELGRRYPSQLSGGQRQRVALARALAIEPRVLLLDEPFGALDARVRQDLRLWLRGLHDRVGLTTVFVTHDQDEALALADRIAVLREGKIEQVGTSAELINDPVSAFVFGFLGESVRLECHVKGGMAEFGDLAAPPVVTDIADGKAIAVVRLFDIGLRPAPDGGLGGRVRGVREMGPTRRVTIETGGRMVEVVMPSAAAWPAWQHVLLDLSRARFYPS